MQVTGKKIVSVGVSCVLFCTQVAFASLPETKLWAERRLGMSATASNWAPLLKPLSNSRLEAPSTVSTLEPSLENVSSLLQPFGDVREVNLARAKDAPLIVHIQDVHDLREAQSNIAQMILTLQKSGVTSVGVEGAYDPFVVNPYRAMASPETVKKIADFFLDQATVGGPEYAALVAPSPLTLESIEDKTAYLANIDAFHQSLEDRDRVPEAIQSARSRLGALKNEYFPAALMEFDRRREMYGAGQANIGTYLSFLCTRAALSKTDFPQLARLASALEVEKTMDFPAIERERTKLAGALAVKVSAPELQAITDAAIAVRAQRITHAKFYAVISDLCARNRIPLTIYPHLTAYMDYTRLAREIDPEAALREFPQFEARVESTLATTEEQRKLCRLNADLSLVDELTRHEMTPDRWAAYEENAKALRARFESLNKDFPKDAVTALKKHLTFIESRVTPYEDFCRCAVQRNGHFISNLTTAMKKSGAKSAVLVAGGFHSQGLSKLMREQGISYLVVTPRITRVDGGNHYLDVLAREPLPVERLFSGEKIDLASPRVFANPRSLRGQMATGEFLALSQIMTLSESIFGRDGASADEAAIERAIAADLKNFYKRGNVKQKAVRLLGFTPGSALALEIELTQDDGRKERFAVSVSKSDRTPVPAKLGPTVLAHSFNVQGRDVLVRFHEPSRSSLTADILAPIKALDRFRNGFAGKIYYSLVAGWEEGVFRVGAVALANLLVMNTALPGAAALATLSGAGLFAWIGIVVLQGIVFFIAAHVIVIAATSSGNRRAAVADYLRSLISWKSPLMQGTLATFVVSAGFAFNLLIPAVVLLVAFHAVWDLRMAARPAVVAAPIEPSDEDKDNPLGSPLLGLGSTGLNPMPGIQRVLFDRPEGDNSDTRTAVLRILGNLRPGMMFTYNNSSRATYVGAYTVGEESWIVYRKNGSSTMSFSYLPELMSLKAEDETNVKLDKFGASGTDFTQDMSGPVDVQKLTTVSSADLRAFLDYLPKYRNPWTLNGMASALKSSPREDVIPVLTGLLSRATSVGIRETFAMAVLLDYLETNNIPAAELKDALFQPLLALALTYRGTGNSTELNQILDVLMAMDTGGVELSKLLARADLPSGMFAELFDRLPERGWLDEWSDIFVKRLSSDPSLSEAVLARIPILEKGSVNSFLGAAIGNGISADQLGPPGSLARRQATVILLAGSKGYENLLRTLMNQEPDVARRRLIAGYVDKNLTGSTAEYVLKEMFQATYPEEIAELGRLLNLKAIVAQGLHASPLITIEGIRSLIRNLNQMKPLFTDKEYKRIVKSWESLGLVAELALVGGVTNKPVTADGLNYDFAFDGQTPSGRREMTGGLAFIGAPEVGEVADMALLRTLDDWRRALLKANFEALYFVHEGLTGEEARSVLASVAKMVAAYKMFAPKAAEKYEKQYLAILGELAPQLAAIGPRDRLPKELESRVIHDDPKVRDVSSVKTLHTMILLMHDTSRADFNAEAPNVAATRTTLKYTSVTLGITSLDAELLIEDGRVVSKPLLALLKGLRDTKDKPDMKVTLRDNELSGQVQLGFHRAEFAYNLADPDEGGGVELNFFESGETVGGFRLPYLAAALRGIGMKVIVKDKMLKALADKNAGASTARQVEDIATMMVRVLYHTRDLDAMLLNLAGELPKTGKEADTVESVLATLAEILVREGRFPFDTDMEKPERPQDTSFNPFAGYTATRFYNNFKAYVKKSQARARPLARNINRILSELGLPLMPEFEPVGPDSRKLGPGQRTIDRYFNQPIAEGLARGDFVLDAKGIPRRSASNPNLPLLARAAVTDEAASLQAADILDGLNFDVRTMTPVGRIGALPAYQEVVRVPTGESVLLNVLVDPETSSILFARTVLIGADQQPRALSTPELRALLGGVEANERATSPATREQARRLLRMSVQPDLSDSRGVPGLVVSSGDGKLWFGRVMLKGDAQSELPDPTGRRVFLAKETDPSDLAAMQEAAVVLATSGGKLSHVGVTTREMGKVSFVLPDAVWMDDGITLSSVHFGEVTRDENGLSRTSSASRDEVAVQSNDFVVADPTTGKLVLLPKDQQEDVERVLVTLSDLEKTGDTGLLDAFFAWPAGLIKALAGARRGARSALERQIAMILEWTMTFLVRRGAVGTPFFTAVVDRLTRVRATLSPELQTRITAFGAQLFDAELRALERSFNDFETEIPAADSPVELKALKQALNDKMTHATQIQGALSVSEEGLAALKARNDALARASDARAATIVADLGRQVQSAAATNDLELMRRLVANATRAGLGDDAGVKALAEKRDALIRVKKQAILDAKEAVYELDQIDEDHSEVSGPKAGALGRLRKIAGELDAEVPNGLSVTTSAFDLFLAEAGNEKVAKDFQETVKKIELERAKSKPSMAKLGKLGEDIRTTLLSAKVSKDGALAKKIYATIAKLGLQNATFAMRSSGVQEDTNAAAYAGAASSYLFVKQDQVLDVLVQTWASFWLPQGVIYRGRQKGLKESDVRPAVLIQEMINNQIGGVTFTSDPDNGRNRVVTEAALGLTEGVVKGESKISRFVSDSTTFEEIARPVNGRIRYIPTKIVRSPDGNGTITEPLTKSERAQKYPLTTAQVRMIAEKARNLRARFGKDLDIEWGLLNGRWYIFQARAITTGLSSAAPTGTADLLEPFIKGTWLGRAFQNSRVSRAVYYLVVAILESGFFKLGQQFAAAGLSGGWMVAGPFFFALHPILRWAAWGKTNGYAPKALWAEFVSEWSSTTSNFFGSRAFAVLMINILFYGVANTIGTEWAPYLAAILFHFVWDVAQSPYRARAENAADKLGLPPVARIGDAVNPKSLEKMALSRSEVRQVWEDAAKATPSVAPATLIGGKNALIPLGAAKPDVVEGLLATANARRSDEQTMKLVVSAEDAPGYAALDSIKNVDLIVLPPGQRVIGPDGLVDVAVFRAALLSDPVVGRALSAAGTRGDHVVVLPPGVDIPVTEAASALIKELRLDWIRLESWFRGIPLKPVAIDTLIKAALVVQRQA